MKNVLLSIIVVSLLSSTGAYANDALIKRFENALDRNSDGHVTLDEYVTTRAKWGKSEEESNRYFKYHDKDKDGKLTLNEFLASK